MLGSVDVEMIMNRSVKFEADFKACPNRPNEVSTSQDVKVPLCFLGTDRESQLKAHITVSRCHILNQAKQERRGPTSYNSPSRPPLNINQISGIQSAIQWCHVRDR